MLIYGIERFTKHDRLLLLLNFKEFFILMNLGSIEFIGQIQWKYNIWHSKGLLAASSIIA